MIEGYNKKMGRVDLVDNIVACYTYKNSDMLKLYNIYFLYIYIYFFFFISFYGVFVYIILYNILV